MQIETISLEETDCFSKAFIDYISGRESLKPFYNTSPDIENFGSLIKSRGFPKEKRETLREVLLHQYDQIELSEAVLENINSLTGEKTFTITTGHQLNIFTGPLYFIYKIITVINACKELKKAYPDFHFVPVYWMASEDHDFEEISYFHFEGKKISWETDQEGAVGRFDPEELEKIAQGLPEGASFFREAYKEKNLSDAVRAYVNHLFQDEGLVVVDADDPTLKSSLIPVMEADIFQNTPQKLVSETSEKLEAIGLKPQVYPRDINFFYLHENVRERIERSGDQFNILETDIGFSEKEVRELVHSNPERFSPNVILRPLYQEMILPNLAYVGGPSELVYWLQLKSVFDHFQVSFPALMPRNFALICSKKVEKKWNKIGLTTKDLFKESESIHAGWVKKHSNQKLNFKLELEKLTVLEHEMKTISSSIDPTLSQHVEAITRSYQSKIEKAEKKLLRAEKRKHQEKRDQIDAMKESLFPGGTLQERKVNFLNFYLDDPNFIQKLKDNFDPFNYQMYIFFN